MSDKQFCVSFLTSDKGFCPGHKLRLEIYSRIPAQVGQVPVVKYMSPPRIPNKRTMLEPYQFSIAPENASHNNWFADKIVDCFLEKTIPLYWGCPNLHEFFNMDGVLRFNNYEELIAHMESLTTDTYASKLAAVEDNYQRAHKYVPIWGRIETAITEGIERKGVPTRHMQRPFLYPSAAMGDRSGFDFRVKERPHSVSITFDNGFCFDDRSDYKVHVQCEPPEVFAPVLNYDLVNKIIEFHHKYDLLLAWNERILRLCPNAVLFPHTETLGDSN